MIHNWKLEYVFQYRISLTEKPSTGQNKIFYSTKFLSESLLASCESAS